MIQSIWKSAKIRFPMGGGGNIYEKARSAAGTLPGYAWGMFETLFKINKAEKKDRRAANNLKKLRQRVLLPIWIGFPNMHKAKVFLTQIRPNICRC